MNGLISRSGWFLCFHKNEYKTVESRGVDASETYYEIPHWMHLSFVSYEGEVITGQTQSNCKSRLAIPRMYLALCVRNI